MPYKDKNKANESSKLWQREHRSKMRELYKQLRNKAITKLGGKCVNCGCDNYDALEFNHINGGGSKERTSTKGYRVFLYSIINNTRPINDIELTCKVCNALHCLVQLKHLPNNWTITYVSTED